jgi:hypothetical protein
MFQNKKYSLLVYDRRKIRLTQQKYQAAQNIIYHDSLTLILGEAACRDYQIAPGIYGWISIRVRYG